MKTLKDVKVGETATVAKLHGEGPVKRRIMDMGITKGTRVSIIAEGPDEEEAVKALTDMLVKEVF